MITFSNKLSIIVIFDDTFAPPSIAKMGDTPFFNTLSIALISFSSNAPTHFLFLKILQL